MNFVSLAWGLTLIALAGCGRGPSDSSSPAADLSPQTSIAAKDLSLSGGCGRLDAGAVLRGTPTQGTLVSCNQNYTAVMQNDGNFVVYPKGGAAIWHTRTNGVTGAFMSFQGDGNLVIYGADTKPRWHSHTSSSATGAFLVLQDDGNLVVYSSANIALWSSKTGLLANVASCDVASKTCHCPTTASRGLEINRCLATVKANTEMFGERWTTLLTGKVYILYDQTDQIVIDFPTQMRSDSGTGRCGWLDTATKTDVYDNTCAHFIANPGFKNNLADKPGMITAFNTHDVDIMRVIVNGNYVGRFGRDNCNIYDLYGMTSCANISYISCTNCILQHSAIANGVNDNDAQHYGYMSTYVDTPGIIVYNNLFAHAGKTSYISTPVFTDVAGQRQNCFEMVARSVDMRNINIAGNQVFECGDGGLVFNVKSTRLMTGNIQYNGLYQKEYMNISHEILVYSIDDKANPWVDLGGPWDSTDPNAILMIHDNTIDCAWGTTGTARDGKKGCPVGISIGGRGWKQTMWILGGKVYNNSISNARIGIDVNQGGMRASIRGDRLSTVLNNCFSANITNKINFNPQGSADMIANKLVGNCQGGPLQAYDNVVVPTFNAFDTWSCSWGRGNPDCKYPTFPDP